MRAPRRNTAEFVELAALLTQFPDLDKTLSGLTAVYKQVPLTILFVIRIVDLFIHGVAVRLLNVFVTTTASFCM